MNCFEELEQEIFHKIATGEVFIAGDFNSRSADLPDYVASEIDYISYPCLNCPRHNIDGVINSHGRKLIDLCIKSGVQVLNGRNLFKANTNQYTCFRYNGNSVVDLLITSASLL